MIDGYRRELTSRALAKIKSAVWPMVCMSHSGPFSLPASDSVQWNLLGKVMDQDKSRNRQNVDA